MPHLHLNAATRNMLFNWLTRLPGFDARWRLMARFKKAWRIKELRRETDEYMKAKGRELAAVLDAQDTPDDAGNKPRGVARFDLSVLAADLQKLATTPPFYELDYAMEQYKIETADLEALYALTAPLRAEPEKGAEGGAVAADPCKACGKGGKLLAGDEVYGAICEALDDAYEASKKDRPCPTCRDRSALRAVPTDAADAQEQPETEASPVPAPAPAEA